MKNKMKTREKTILGMLLGLVALLAIGAAFAATNDSSAQKTLGQGYGPRDGSGYGRGQGYGGMMGGARGDITKCPMRAALEAQGVSDEEFAAWHNELVASGKMGPGAMRALLKEKGIDTTGFPEPGSRRFQQ